MTIKAIATTEEEIPIYEQEENLARVYERREEEYSKLLERLENMPRPYNTGVDKPIDLALDICGFLLREVQYKKLV